MTIAHLLCSTYGGIARSCPWTADFLLYSLFVYKLNNTSLRICLGKFVCNLLMGDINKHYMVLIKIFLYKSHLIKEKKLRVLSKKIKKKIAKKLSERTKIL